MMPWDAVGPGAWKSQWFSLVQLWSVEHDIIHFCFCCPRENLTMSIVQKMINEGIITIVNDSMIMEVLIVTDVPGHNPPCITYAFDPFVAIKVDFGEFMKDIARKFGLPFMEGVAGEMQFELKRKKGISTSLGGAEVIHSPCMLFHHFGVLSRKESHIDFFCGEEVHVVNIITDEEPNWARVLCAAW